MRRHRGLHPLMRLSFHVVLAFLCDKSFADPSPVGVIGAGTKYVTPYFIYVGPDAGPTVLLAGMGDNATIAPTRALEEIVGWPIRRGRLVVVPGAAQLLGRATTAATVRSDIETFLRELQPDWVVELSESEKSFAIHGNLPGTALPQAGKLVEAANRSLGIDAPPLTLDLSDDLSGPIARSASASLKIPTITTVTASTGKTQPESLRIRQHRLIIHQLLSDMKMIDVDENAIVPRETGGRIRVAMYDAEGSGSPGPLKMEPLFATLPDLLVRRVGPAEIRAGVLKQFDVLIQPGGSGSGQARALEDSGKDAIRTFVERGGGFIGICAGCYLSTCKYEWSLGLINAKTVDSRHWNRGRADLQLELTPLGKEIFGDEPGAFTCMYHNGPVLAAADDPKLPAFQPLAYFRTEKVGKDAEAGLMIGTPAIVAGVYGKGKVISISPHPEQTPGLERFVPRAIRWTVGREVEASTGK